MDKCEVANGNPSHSEVRREVFCISLICLIFLGSFYKVLILQSNTFCHDSLQWYPLFQFFAESLYQGNWPYWNPYTHNGEPFYFNYLQNQFLNPVKLLCILIGKVIDADLLTLYHFATVSTLMVTNIGTYLFLRGFSRHFSTRIVLFLVISFSSFSLLSMRLLGLLETMLYAPWILYFCVRIIEDREKPVNWIALAVLVGLSLHTYGVIYYVTTLFILALSFLYWNREVYSAFFSIFRREKRGLLLLVILIVLALSSPLWTAVFFDLHSIIPVARTMDDLSDSFFISPEKMIVIEAKWRSAVTPQDLVSVLNPFYHFKVFNMIKLKMVNETTLTESIIYIGIFPFFAAVYGFFKGKHQYKSNFLTTFVVLFLLMLGASFGFYIIFSFLFPPLLLQRHPMQFIPFFLIFLQYFFVIGMDGLIDAQEALKEKATDKRKLQFTFIGAFLFFSLFQLFTFQGPSAQLLFSSSLFIGACLFTFMLVRGEGSIRSFQYSVLFFVIFDLFLFNFFYRPFMQPERNRSLETHFVSMVLPQKSYDFIGKKTRFLRYRTLLFRRKAIDRNLMLEQSSFFETKYFHKLVVAANNNLRTVSGFDRPLVLFYDHTVPYKEEYYKEFFRNAEQNNVFQDQVFLHDSSTEFISEPQEGEIRTVIENLEYSPEKIVFNTDSPVKRFMYLTDGYDKYWKAFLDNEEVELYRANINYKGIFLPAGKHVVSFEYDPIFHKASIYLYFITLFLTVLYCIPNMVNSKKRERGDGS